MTSSALDREGLVQLYYGPGKGKTTAAMGAALRAHGQGLSISIIQFMKGHEDWGDPYGEITELRTCEDIEIKQFPAGHIRDVEELPTHERETLMKGLEVAERAIADKGNDLVVLDELTLLDTFGVVETPRLVDLLTYRDPSIEVLITGRKAEAPIVNAADYVTYMAEVKHPYSRGIDAVSGIEY